MIHPLCTLPKATGGSAGSGTMGAFALGFDFCLICRHFSARYLRAARLRNERDGCCLEMIRQDQTRTGCNIGLHRGDLTIYVILGSVPPTRSTNPRVRSERGSLQIHWHRNDRCDRARTRRNDDLASRHLCDTYIIRMFCRVCLTYKYDILCGWEET